MESLSSLITGLSSLAPLLYVITLAVPALSHVVFLVIKRRQVKDRSIVEQITKGLEDMAPRERERAISRERLEVKIEEMKQFLAEIDETSATDEDIAKVRRLSEQLTDVIRNKEKLDKKEASIKFKRKYVEDATAKLRRQVERREALLQKLDLFVSAKIISFLQRLVEYLGNSTVQSQTMKSRKAGQE